MLEDRYRCSGYQLQGVGWLVCQALVGLGHLGNVLPNVLLPGVELLFSTEGLMLLPLSSLVILYRALRFPLAEAFLASLASPARQANLSLLAFWDCF